MESIVQYYLNQGYRITSPFGWRIHPTYKDLRFHYGIDLGGKVRGTPIRFPYHGKIRHTAYHSIYGNLIMVESARMQVLFMFAHCHDIQVKVGQSITPGQVIGTVGATGNATGPHIHLEIRADDGSKMGGKVWGDPEDYFEGDDVMHHKVKAGETAARIAAQYGITLEELAAANPQVADLNKIYVDQILAIPQKVVSPDEIPGTKDNIKNVIVKYEDRIVPGVDGIAADPGRTYVQLRAIADVYGFKFEPLDGKSWSSGVRLVPKAQGQEIQDDKTKRLVAEFFRVTEELKQSVKE